MFMYVTLQVFERLKKSHAEPNYKFKLGPSNDTYILLWAVPYPVGWTLAKNLI